MAEHPNAELVRKGFDAFVAGDMVWMNEHLHENIVWHNPGNNVLSGDFHGREAVLALFAKTVTYVMPDLEVHDVVANDDHAVALVNSKIKRHDNGETFESRGVTAFHVANDQALEAWNFFEDEAGLDAFLEGLG